MADQKLTELAQATQAVDADLLYIVQSNVSRRISVSSLAATIEIPRLVSATDGSSLTLISQVPATVTSTGTRGQLAYDTAYIYFCTGTNTWRRLELTSW